MLRLLSILFYSAVFYLHNSRANADPIIGVKVRRALKNEFPYVVSVAWNDRYSPQERNHICTGTLISARHVLTAAHCFEKDKSLRDIVILLGSSDLRSCKKYYPKSLILYDEWALWNNKVVESDTFDTAILTLTEDVRDPNVNPVTISTLKDEQLYDKSVAMAGWGRTKDNLTPRFMEVGIVNVLTRDECELKLNRVIHEYEIFTEDRHLCTSAEPYVLQSPGDSGGPLILNGMILGIHEGVCPDLENVPRGDRINFHGSIHFYRRFIDDVMNKWFKKGK